MALIMKEGSLLLYCRFLSAAIIDFLINVLNREEPISCFFFYAYIALFLK
jgi:hypothetical protein